MKKTFLLLTFLILFVASNSFGQAKQTYEIANLKQILTSHKTVAILPMRVTISYKKFPKNYNAADNAVQEREEGINMQQGMYTYLLRKSNDYFVTFQETQRTNILLKQANIFDKIDAITADSICKILKVDAVIQAGYAYQRTGSEAAAIAKTLVFGFGGSTASGSLTMQINDGKDGNLLWRFYKQMNEGVFSTADEMMQRMMKKVARNFPYEK
ncbi:hypothetical protein ACFQZS_08815 [Mucilaginibacter calamicampi]|uniref:DUF4410 domain-containing protein n=1 Tax=Mucilaginibacter calamicampi TaxID=1302352 RepID=A0ABW2YUW7_9SPHI